MSFNSPGLTPNTGNSINSYSSTFNKVPLNTPTTINSPQIQNMPSISPYSPHKRRPSAPVINMGSSLSSENKKLLENSLEIMANQPNTPNSNLRNAQFQRLLSSPKGLAQISPKLQGGGIPIGNQLKKVQRMILPSRDQIVGTNEVHQLHPSLTSPQLQKSMSAYQEPSFFNPPINLRSSSDPVSPNALNSFNNTLSASILSNPLTNPFNNSSTFSPAIISVPPNSAVSSSIQGASSDSLELSEFDDADLMKISNPNKSNLFPVGLSPPPSEATRVISVMDSSLMVTQHPSSGSPVGNIEPYQISTAFSNIAKLPPSNSNTIANSSYETSAGLPNLYNNPASTPTTPARKNSIVVHGATRMSLPGRDQIVGTSNSEMRSPMLSSVMTVSSSRRTTLIPAVQIDMSSQIIANLQHSSTPYQQTPVSPRNQSINPALSSSLNLNSNILNSPTSPGLIISPTMNLNTSVSPFNNSGPINGERRNSINSKSSCSFNPFFATDPTISNFDESEDSNATKVDFNRRVRNSAVVSLGFISPMSQWSNNPITPLSGSQDISKTPTKATRERMSLSLNMNANANLSVSQINPLLSPSSNNSNGTTPTNGRVSRDSLGNIIKSRAPSISSPTNNPNTSSTPNPALSTPQRPSLTNSLKPHSTPTLKPSSHRKSSSFFTLDDDDSVLLQQQLEHENFMKNSVRQ